jgi:hypothetical protein
MNQQALREQLEAMAVLDSVQGCAVVDLDNGMVWQHAGALPQLQALVESCCDYWRLAHRRKNDFAPLGDMRALVAIHGKARVTLVGCGTGLLLVTLSDEPDRMNWQRWTAQVHALRKLLASF